MGSASILIVAASHGDPPTQPRPQRARELAVHLSRAGFDVDLLLFAERPFHPADERKLSVLNDVVRRMWTVRAPETGGWWGRARSCMQDAFRAASVRDCPSALLSRLRRLRRDVSHDAVILGSPRFLPAVPLFARSAKVLLDLRRLPEFVSDSLRRLGREDAVAVPGAATVDVLATPGLDGVLFHSVEDAMWIDSAGTAVSSIVVPPVVEMASATTAEPVRPPRLLFVGSETVANLDAVRWFRRRVLPRIQRLVPTCRLRIVGEAGRHIEPGLDTDRVGWVDAIEREYRDASVVLVPLRVGGQLRRRVVEGIAHGKALALTTEAAYGSGVLHRRGGIVTSDPEALAQGIVDVLNQEVLRRRFEERSRQAAAERFAPSAAFAELLVLLSDSPVSATRTSSAVITSPGTP